MTRRLLTAVAALAATTLLRGLAWWDDRTMRGES